MSKTQIAKTVVNFLTVYGIGASTGTIIRSTIPRPENKALAIASDVAVLTTSVAVSSMVQDQVRDYTDQKIDEIIAAFKTGTIPTK